MFIYCSVRPFLERCTNTRLGQQLLSSLNEGIFIINEWVGVVSYSIILNLISEVVSPRISISWDGWPIKALLHFSARDGNAVSSLGYAPCKSGKTDPRHELVNNLHDKHVYRKKPQHVRFVLYLQQ